jgi:dTDP-3-amino-3,4,6-trideoxy-alpha-D-glucose transaminase
LGATPVFADVDASGLLDLGHADDVLKQMDVKPKAMVPVHLYGHAMNLEWIESFASHHELIVVEDCAQSVGARSAGRPVGAVSEACATSFYPTKNLGAFGDAGALLCKTPAIRERAMRLRDYGQSKKYVHTEVGLNSRLDELQAALLRDVQLPALEQWTSRRRAIATRYLAEISNEKLSLPLVPNSSESVWHLFPLLVDGDRESFREHLKAQGVATGLHYPYLIPDQQAFASSVARRPPPLPRAMSFANREVSIPLHPYLSDKQVTTVISCCNSWKE